jgi:hypothetical protein
MAASSASWIMVILAIVIIVGIIKAIFRGPVNNPTWKGIIISALLGLLPMYLICCFLGWLGEERD